MSKKFVVTISFIILSIGLFLVTANEYVKRVEKKAIDVYLQSIIDESREHSLDIVADSTICSGFIKHICTIDNITISNDDVNIFLQHITIEIVDIAYNQIGVQFSINDISHTFDTNPYLVFLPKQFKYSLHLIKQDSALGYVMLNRAVYMNFGKFDMNLELDVLLREKLFRDKSILFLIKEWFDQTTPSFYEYSLDDLKVSIKANNINDYYVKHFGKYGDSLYNMMNDARKVFKQNDFKNRLAIEYFDKFIQSFVSLLDGKMDKISLEVYRKNNDLIFFDKLSNEATLKKMLEITEILDSINSTYNIYFDAKR